MSTQKDTREAGQEHADERMLRAQEKRRRGNVLKYPQTAEFSGGMTLREHYAGLAMQGILSNTDYMNSMCAGASDVYAIRREVASAAAGQADALLEELAREGDVEKQEAPPRGRVSAMEVERFKKWALAKGHAGMNFSGTDDQFVSASTQKVFEAWLRAGMPEA